MALTRRQFLKLMGGSAAGAIVFQACGVPEKELLVQSSLQLPEDMVTGVDNWYATLCRQCPTSEGIVVRVMEGRAKKVEGNVDYPINRGKHSARCEAGLQALYHPDRIRGPLLRDGDRGSGRWREIEWADAIGRLTYQLRLLQDARDQAAMVLVTNPVGAHLGMVVERFASRFGGRHVPYEPLELTNLREAMRQVFKQDVMPDFDIENAEYVLSFGADFLNTWVSPVHYARGYGQFRQGQRERGAMVHVDSRFSMTAANADRWVYVRPGYEGILALSIAQALVAQGVGDQGVVNALTGGVINLDSFAPEQVADRTGVRADAVRRIAAELAAHGPRSLIIGGGSAAAHSNGLFNLSAIYSLNYLVGSVGQPGGIIFNPRPPLDDIPVAPRGASFREWRQLVDEMRQGRVKVMIVRGADPWHGLPNALGFKDAFFNVPFVFSFSSFMDDTSAMSDLILPEHVYLEDWGSDVPTAGPGYQVVGFQQPVVRPFFEPRGVHLGAKNFADSLLAAAEGLNLDMGLPGETFRDILQDGARKLFELGRGSVQASDARAFWNGVLQRGGWWDTEARSTDAAPAPSRIADVAEPAFDSSDTGAFPFHLVPFASTSLGDGGGAHLPWLQATPDPLTTATWSTWVEINSSVAEKMGIREGDVIKVTSPYGEIEALAFPHPAAPTDVVSIPVGQGHLDYGRYAKGRGANVLSILSPEISDSVTGALAWAATRVRIEKTGGWVRLPKFEGTTPEPPRDEEHHIVEITAEDT
jgi:anaerobic selenocysteine-containing dehydrogenase